ncbi:MAG: hypothetical protein JXR21_05135, partial [Candidatus Marinimicrobia bacterium]|nr:hypothetical protein [Candidatus Neomarinimicrobiota bacterium]
MKRRLLIFMSLVNMAFVFPYTIPDSLLVHGRVMLDSMGMADVSIAGIKTDNSGYYSFKVPVGTDTTLVPHRYAFLFTPAEYHISSQDTVLDSIHITARRQIKKTLVVAGQSNTGSNGAYQYFIPDTVDEQIPYYLAYGGVEHGLSTLGLISKFGILNLNTFGIETPLGRTIYKQYEDSLAVMKIGWGGTSLILNWGETGNTWTWFKEMHEHAVDSMHAEGYEPEYIGFFWYQGESDRTLDRSNVYGDSLYHFVDRIREYFPNSSKVNSLPFICVRILWNSDNIYEGTVRQAQMDIVDHRTHTAWIDMDDCDPYRISKENIHYNGIALNRIGYKLATTYLDLVGHPVDSSTSVTLDFYGSIDSSMTFEVNGDRTLVSNISPSCQFLAKLGDSLLIRPVPGDDYVFEPAEINIPFVYDPSVILDGAYSFNINNILTVQGRVMLDSCGLAGVEIGSEVTDSNGYYIFQLLSGKDTTFTPVYKNFIFDPPSIVIDALDTYLDSMNITAKRQVKKVIVISGQSNAEHVGEPKFFISDTVDNHIPYYLAYSGGEYGLSTLGLLTKFGKSYDFCKSYNCGFGLEMLLARTLYKRYTDSLAVMKMPYSGTSLYADWKEEGGTWLWFVDQHEKAVEAMHHAGYEPEYIGFFWFQGESDEELNPAAYYAGNLQQFVDRVRVRFANNSVLDHLPFVCVRINWNASSPYESTIRAAQADLPNHRDDCAWVNIDDCNPNRYSSKNTHFNGHGLNKIGYKLAAQYLDMVGAPLDSCIRVRVDLDEALDTAVVLTVSGDTSFSDLITGLDYSFTSTLGSALILSLNLGSETYTCSPAAYSIPFAYDLSALYDQTYSFNVSKVVGIAPYPENMDYLLLKNYPNPFNPATRFDFHIPSSGEVSLEIYSLHGKKIATLIDREMKAGDHSIT